MTKRRRGSSGETFSEDVAGNGLLSRRFLLGRTTSLAGAGVGAAIGLPLAATARAETLNRSALVHNARRVAGAVRTAFEV